MIKFPKGISNYNELIEEGYYYVDKTNKMMSEIYSDKNI